MAKKVRASELVEGIKVYPLDADLEVVEAFMLLKCKDPTGGLGWSFRKTSGVSNEELLGALEVQKQLVLSTLLEDWTVD